jgi:hypothetical protein
MRAAVLIALACFTVGCTKRDVPPPPPPAPTTGWTVEATQAVSASLMDAAGRDAWAAQWKARNQGAAPVVVVRPVEDRTGDNLPVQDIRAAMAARLREAGGDRLAVSETGEGTVVLSGVATLTPGTHEGARVNWYRIDLRLTDAAGEVLWPGSVEHPLPPVR